MASHVETSQSGVLCVAVDVVVVVVVFAQGVSNLIHDTNKKVRVAFVNLLGRVKGVRSIKYYHVVSVDHILARLSEDHLR